MKNNVAIAMAYYRAMNDKNLASISQYLHSDVHFVGPMAEFTGKEAVLESAKGFVGIFKTLTIRASFGSENQAMLVLDLDCPAPIGIFRTASLLTIKDGLIVRIELFYDARPLEKKRDDIFGNTNS